MFWYEVLLYWSELKSKDNISTFQDVVNLSQCFNSHAKYNKTVLYAPSLVQQGTVLIADIPNADMFKMSISQ